MTIDLPESLNARIKTVVVVDWYDLVPYLVKVWDMDSDLRPHLLETSNDTNLDINLTSISDYDRKEAEEDREKILGKFSSGGIEEYYLYQLMTIAHLDGHLPAARYMVKISW